MAYDWREIPCSRIDWHSFMTGKNRRVAWLLERQCSEPTDFVKKHDPEDVEKRWHTMTLGELADRGEKWWRRHGSNFGAACVEAIKNVIDHAAAGYEVRKSRHNMNAYVPREIAPPPPELAAKDEDA